MKEIVIVEDCPWLIQDAVSELTKHGIKVSKLLYLHNRVGFGDVKERLVRTFEYNTGVAVVDIKTEDEFVANMEKLYTFDDIVFLINFYSRCSDDKVSVKYMKYKGFGDKFWLYKLPVYGDIGDLCGASPNVIPMIDYENAPLVWDIEVVKSAIKA